MKILIFIILVTGVIFSQGFDVTATGKKKFTFTTDGDRNQIRFISKAPFEDIDGVVTDLYGTVEFDVKSPQTMKGNIVVKVAAMRTGINLRDQHLRGSEWLDANQYPYISFDINSFTLKEKESGNKLIGVATGNFTMRGITKSLNADVELIYLDESEKTRERAPGDLLGVKAKFSVKLSEYNVKNVVIGQKVAETISIEVSMVGFSGTR